MKRASLVRSFILVATAAACTVPEYRFAADDAGGPTLQGRDSGASSSGASDASPDVADASDTGAEPIDAAPLPNTVMPSTADFNADCTGFGLADSGASLLQDGDATNHCVIFLHNASYGRPWAAAKATCETITRGAKRGHLAIFPNATKANNLIAKTTIFPGTLAAWIGLELTGPNALDLTSWTWLGGATTAAFNGWAPAHPAGQKCTSWAGASSAQWLDADCSINKGMLCEMDE